MRAYRWVTSRVRGAESIANDAVGWVIEGCDSLRPVLCEQARRSGKRCPPCPHSPWVMVDDRRGGIHHPLTGTHAIAPLAPPASSSSSSRLPARLSSSSNLLGIGSSLSLSDYYRPPLARGFGAIDWAAANIQPIHGSGAPIICIDTSDRGVIGSGSGSGSGSSEVQVSAVEVLVGPLSFESMVVHAIEGDVEARRRRRPWHDERYERYERHER